MDVEAKEASAQGTCVARSDTTMTISSFHPPFCMLRSLVSSVFQNCQRDVAYVSLFVFIIP